MKKKSSIVKKTKRTCSLSQNESLVYLNAIKWDIKDNYNSATLNNFLLNKYPDQYWCSKELVLLLPITVNGKFLDVYYTEKIRKQNITFIDILKTIYHFYQKTRVTIDDLMYVAMSDNLKEFIAELLEMYGSDRNSIRNLRFISFLQNKTKFTGLTHQRDNIYSINFV